jgi:hypothetical protein
MMIPYPRSADPPAWLTASAAPGSGEGDGAGADAALTLTQLLKQLSAGVDTYRPKPPHPLRSAAGSLGLGTAVSRGLLACYGCGGRLCDRS